jgi:hypothetical protein
LPCLTSMWGPDHHDDEGRGGGVMHMRTDLFILLIIPWS